MRLILASRACALVLILLGIEGCSDQAPIDPAPADRSVWRVRTDGSGEFTDIQAAVNAATTGDTILVGPGHYSSLHEGIVGGVPRIAVIVVSRSSTLRSIAIVAEAGPESTIIGDVSSTDYVAAFGGLDSGSLSGFNIRGGGNKGVLLFNSGIAIEGNRITGATDAIRCEGGAPIVRSNVVMGNGVGLLAEGAALTTMANRFEANAQRGVVCALGTVAVMQGDTLIGNGSVGLRLSESEATADGLLIARGSGDGISLHASRITLRGSTVVEHVSGSGVLLAGGSELVAARVIIAIAGGCAVDVRGGSAMLACSDLWGVESAGTSCFAPAGGGNIFDDPLFCDVAAGAYGLRSGSPCAPGHTAGCEQIGAFNVSCE